MEWGLESPSNPQTRMSAPRGSAGFPACGVQATFQSPVSPLLIKRLTGRFQGCEARHFPLNRPMKSLTEHLWFEVPNRRGYVNITDTVEGLVRKSGVKEGLCLVNAMHITASVFINDNESGLLHDYEEIGRASCRDR